MPKSASSPQLLGSYVQIDRLWLTLFLSEVVLFSRLGRDTGNFSMFATWCMSVSYLSSSCIIFPLFDIQKGPEFAAFGVSNM